MSQCYIAAIDQGTASSRCLLFDVRVEDQEWVGEMLGEEFRGSRVQVVVGGDSRQESVQNALKVPGPHRATDRTG